MKRFGLIHKRKNPYKYGKWIRLKEKIKARANFCCERCGMGDVMLSVHHKTQIPNAKVWEYPDEDLICVCSRCHGYYHSNKYKKEMNHV